MASEEGFEYKALRVSSNNSIAGGRFKKQARLSVRGGVELEEEAMGAWDN